MTIIFTAIIILLLFSFTIFVHELGHYLAARWMGLVIDTFSIGMGPAIWKKKYRGVVYKIGMLPIGGYVALPQLDPEIGSDQAKDTEVPKRDLPQLSPWRKIPVQIAGVVCNLILAFIIAVIIYFSGSGPAYSSTGASVGFVSTNSPAYEAGIRMGDQINYVNGNEISSWDEFVVECALNEEVDLEIEATDGELKQIEMDTVPISQGGRMITGLAKSTPCFVLEVVTGSSAEKAGIQRGDVITRFNGIKLFGVDHLIDLVDQHASETVDAEILRKGDKITVRVTPEYDEEAERALIGIYFNPYDIHRKPIEQIKGWGSPVFRILKALVTPSEAKNAASALGGPVSIFRMFWWAAQSSLLLALWFTGLINVNLAILNILPIPILDGGHLLFSLIEIVTGKPMNAKVLLFLYKIFMILLITIFVLITFNDFRRMFSPLLPEPADQAEEVAPEQNQ